MYFDTLYSIDIPCIPFYPPLSACYVRIYWHVYVRRYKQRDDVRPYVRRYGYIRRSNTCVDVSQSERKPLPTLVRSIHWGKKEA